MAENCVPLINLQEFLCPSIKARVEQVVENVEHSPEMKAACFSSCEAHDFLFKNLPAEFQEKLEQMFEGFNYRLTWTEDTLYLNGLYDGIQLQRELNALGTGA